MAYRGAVDGARTVTEVASAGKANVRYDRGVQISLRAEPGMSAPLLLRTALCHIAAANGEGTTNEADPLLVPGSTVRVDESETGYVISVRTGDADSAAEAMRRAHAMMAVLAQ